MGREEFWKQASDNGLVTIHFTKDDQQNNFGVALSSLYLFK